jgi:hypothetical protein
VNHLNQRDLHLHITVLGWLYVVGHAIFLLIGLFIFMLLTGIGVVSGDSTAMMVLSVIGTAVGLVLVTLAIPGLVAGYGLLTRKSWGRILAIVVGILSLINFPLGTAVGIYTLWVLFQEEATDYFTFPKPA